MRGAIAHRREAYHRSHPITSRIFWYPFWGLRLARARLALLKLKNHMELLLAQMARGNWVLSSVCAAIVLGWAAFSLTGHSLCSFGAPTISCQMSGFFLTFWGVQAAVVTLLGLTLTLSINTIQQAEIPVPTRALRSEAWLGITALINAIPILWPIFWMMAPGSLRRWQEPVPIPLVLVGWVLLVRSLSVLLTMTRSSVTLQSIRDYVLTLLTDLCITTSDWRLFPLWEESRRCSLWREIVVRRRLSQVDRLWLSVGGQAVALEQISARHIQVALADRRSDGTTEQLQVLDATQRIIDSDVQPMLLRPPAAMKMQEVFECAAALSRGLAASATRPPVADWDSRVAAVADVISCAALNVSLVRHALKVPREPLGTSKEGLPLGRVAITPGMTAAGESIPMQKGFPSLWSFARACLPSGAFYSHARDVYDIEGTASRFPDLLWACIQCGTPEVFFSRVLLPSARGALRKSDQYSMVLAMRQVARGGGTALHRLLARTDWPQAALENDLEGAVHNLIVRAIIDMRLIQTEAVVGVSLRQVEMCNVIREVVTVGGTGSSAFIVHAAEKAMAIMDSLIEGDAPSTGAGELGAWTGLPSLDSSAADMLKTLLTTTKPI